MRLGRGKRHRSWPESNDGFLQPTSAQFQGGKKLPREAHRHENLETSIWTPETKTLEKKTRPRSVVETKPVVRARIETRFDMFRLGPRHNNEDAPGPAQKLDQLWAVQQSPMSADCHTANEKRLTRNPVARFVLQ